jgi:hypothetical protein
MDISRVLEMLRPFFESRKEPYALVGGLALLSYGAARATFDVDILALRESQRDLVAFLERHGFRTLGVQPGFSNHQHEDTGLGRVDVIYVSGTTADAMFSGSRSKPITTAVEAPVPRIEHLVAMKVQAFASDPTRYSDLADLEFLLALPDVDHEEARRYFEAAGLASYFERLCRP